MAAVQNIDLNLFRLLATMYEERSVARTAERLFLTPSAVSHALRRLRMMLGDDLFVRGPGGMMPTARAHEVARQLRLLLPQLHDVIVPRAFDPALTERVFSVACVPYTATTWMPELGADFAQAAPRARLDVTLLHNGVVDDLSSGALDVAIGAFRRTPPRLVAEELFREPYVWVVRRDNPLASRRLSLRGLSEIAHVDILIGGASVDPHDTYDIRQGLERLVVQSSMVVTEQAFALAGLRRTVRACAPDSVAAMAMVARTDCACIVPAGVARMFAGSLDLVMLQPPYRTGELVIQMLYHADFGERPAVRWLLDLIRARIARPAHR